MNKKIAALAALPVAGLVIGLSACGGSSQTPSSILQANGYTVAATYSQSNLPDGLGEYATSGAAGDTSTNVEVVIQLNSTGQAEAPAMETLLEQEYPDFSVSLEGSFLVVSAPLSDSSEFGTS